MKNNRLKQFWFMGVSTLLMVVFLGVMMLIINDLQGNARVINYAGIVRGATQRLVKNELQGIPDDNEIVRLDDILIGLQTGESSHDIEVLSDEEFQEKLKSLADKWSVLKDNIIESRNDESKRVVLYETSETYFFMADDTVSSAEKYSSALTQKLKIVQVLIVADILIIMLSLLFQILAEIKLNRKLNRIAYVDPNTGLPNKRSCEEQISDGGLYDKTHNVCCFMFDLNNLKVVNDTLGHKAGDTFIASFASILRRSAPPYLILIILFNTLLFTVIQSPKKRHDGRSSHLVPSYKVFGYAKENVLSVSFFWPVLSPISLWLQTSHV